MGVGMLGVRVDVNEVLKFWGKFKKKLGGSWGSVTGGGGGVRVDVNEELKFLGKFKKIFFLGGGGQGVGSGVGLGGQDGCDTALKFL